MPNESNPTSVQDAFIQYEKNVARVPDDQNSDGKDVHPQVRAAVEAELPVAKSFLSGSYGRRTQACRLKDVDVIVVLDDEDGTYAGSASDTLEAVRKAVLTCKLVERTRVSVRAVKAYLHNYEFHVDIVPALPPLIGDGLRLTRNLPGEAIDDWSLEYPAEQLTAATDKNAATGGIYIPTTRIIKAWNQRYPTAKPLRSYHAEAMLYHALTKQLPYAEAVVAFFDHAYDALAPGQLTPTPGAPGDRFVDDRLADDKRAEARCKIDKARSAANAAAAIEDPDEAMEAWLKLFGPGFPAPSTTVDATERALKRRTIGRSGAGLAAGTTASEIIPTRSWRAR
jgi:hypothetical protein